MTDTAHDGSVPRFEVRHRMRRTLEHSGTSIGEMAELLGVDRSTVGRYLNGHTEPRLAVLRVWAMRTGVPLDWIRYGIEPADGDDHPPSGVITRDTRGYLRMAARVYQLPVAA